MSKECIKVRVGAKVYSRILEQTEGFMLPKNKIPKAYNSEETRYIIIASPTDSKLFEIKNVDMSFTEKICYIQIAPISNDLSENKSTDDVANSDSEIESYSECYLHNRNAKYYLECCISAGLSDGICTRTNCYK